MLLHASKVKKHKFFHNVYCRTTSFLTISEALKISETLQTFYIHQQLYFTHHERSNMKTHSRGTLNNDITLTHPASWPERSVWAVRLNSSQRVSAASLELDPQQALSLWASQPLQNVYGWVICAALPGTGTPEQHNYRHYKS